MYKHHSRNNFNDVGEFHDKFGLYSVTHRGPRPRPLDREMLEFRIKFLLEEVLEFIEAAGYQLTYTQHFNAPPEWGVEQVSDDLDHEKMFDALLDEVYVAMGTAHLLGYPWREGWDRVQSANMKKVRAQADGSNSKRGSALDVVKPEGWTAPDIAEVLSVWGFEVKKSPDPENMYQPKNEISDRWSPR